MADPVRSRRRGALVGACVAVVVVAALIAWYVWPSDPGPATVSKVDAVELAPDREAEVAIDEQWSIRVPRGGVSSSSTLNISRLKIPAPNGGDVPLSSAQLRLTTGQPSAPWTFVWRAERPLPDDHVLYLVDDSGDGTGYDPAADESASVTNSRIRIAEMSADRRTGTAQVDHLSFKSWFEGVISTTTNVLGKFFGTRTGDPDCEGERPKWLDAPVFLEDINGPLKVCVGADPKDSAVAVVKIANNRGGAMVVTSPVAPSWAWQRPFSDHIDELFNTTVNHALLGIGVAQEALGRNWLLMPGDEIHLGFNEDALRAAGISAALVARTDPLLMAAGALAKLMWEATDKGLDGTSAWSYGLLAVCVQGVGADVVADRSATGIAAAVLSLAKCGVEQAELIVGKLRASVPTATWQRLSPQVYRTANLAKVALSRVLAVAAVTFVTADAVTTLWLDAAAFTVTLFPTVKPKPAPADGATVVRFDSVGESTLRLTAKDLVARGYTNKGNQYEGANASCVRYAKDQELLDFSVESATGRVLAIGISGVDRSPRTQIGGIRSGSTLADLRKAFAGHRIEEHFTFDFGQGSNGVIVHGDGGSIAFSLDDAPSSAYTSGTALVVHINGVGLPGFAPTNAENGC